MSNSATLAVKIVSDAKGAVAGIDSTSSKLGKMGRVAGVAGAAVAAGGVAAAAGLVSAVKSAANLQQSIGAVDTVFKGSANQMHTWAKGAATDVGLTRNEFNELGTLIGSQLKNGGTAMDELAPKTRNLIKTGADLSSMFGGTTREAVEALSSALKGERDPIERYGVSLNQAKIDAEAASLGFKKVGGALSAEAQQAATLSLIMNQTKDAHGNFARESGTLAHQQQVLSASLSNVKDQIGTALLPIATSLFTFLNSTGLPAVKGMFGAFRQWAGESGGLGQAVAAIQPVLATWAGAILSLVPVVQQFVTGQLIPFVRTVAGALAPILQRIATTVIPALAAAWRTVIPAVGELLAALRPFIVVVAQRLTPIVQRLLPVVTTVFRTIATVVAAAIRTVAAVIRTVTAVLRGDWAKAWAGIKSIIANVWGLIKAIVKGAVSILASLVRAAWSTIKSLTKAAWDNVVSLLKSAWDRAKNAVRDGVSDAISTVKELPGKIKSALSGAGSLLTDIGRNIIEGLIGGIKSMAQSVVNTVSDVVGGAKAKAKSLLGINSPSRVFRDLGRYTGQGLRLGILDERRNVERAMADLIRVPSAPVLTVGSRRASTGDATAHARPPVRVDINFNGLVTDPQAVAREIRKILTDQGVILGGVA